jgi:hypothetical protein
LRKKAAVHHNDVGDDLPTTDEVQAAAVKKVAKQKVEPPKAPKTAKDVKTEEM